jgi:citrate synthase
LFSLAQEAGVSGRFLDAAQAIERALKQFLGKALPINIDGAMAAILLEIGFPPGLANPLFMVARVTGILAHAHEEQKRMSPMRRIHPVEHGYSGPTQRKLNPES